MKPVNDFLHSAIVQAFVAAAIAIGLLKVFENRTIAYIMSTGRGGGGGVAIASTIFLGVLAYRLGRDYLAGRR